MNKKERDRIKRKHKQQEQRKRHAKMKYQVIADETQPLQCYINGNWRTEGIASIVVLKTLRSGGYAMGAFLVDLWCCGLKDSWGMLEITSSQFEDMLKKGDARGLDNTPIDMPTVRRLVAGGIRFAIQNGFRLPSRYQRWVAMLGIDPEDTADADLSGFGIEGGKLRYIGPIEDLRRRLISQSVDDFLARPDVQYIARVAGDGEDEYYDEDEYEEEEDSDDEEEDDDEPVDSDQAMDEVLNMAGQRLASAVRKACFARGEAPSPMLDEAAGAIFEALMETPGLPQDENEKPSAEVIEEHTRLVDRALELRGEDAQPELRRALQQVGTFIQSNPSAREFTRAMGFGEDAEE